MDSTLQILTAGQQRVREIVLQHLPAFLRGQEEATTYGEKVVARHQSSERLRPALMSDATIRGDSVTGQRLDRPAVSGMYIQWLFDHSTRGSDLEDLRRVRLDRFLYHLPSVREHPHAFAGGSKWHTTMGTLFSLAAEEPGDDLLSERIEATYYRRSGILATGGDGRHRLLAQVLWGELRHVGEIYVCDEDDDAVDEELNRALLTVGERWNETTERRRRHFPFGVKSRDDAELLKKLVQSMDPAEWRVLFDYLNVASTSSNVAGPVWLQSRLALLRQIRERPVRSLWSWGPGRRPATTGPDFAFESWYRRALPSSAERWYLPWTQSTGAAVAKFGRGL